MNAKYKKKKGGEQQKHRGQVAWVGEQRGKGNYKRGEEKKNWFEIKLNQMKGEEERK